MESLRLIRTARPARITRPMALMSAMATLIAALFICFGAAGHGAIAPEGRGPVVPFAGQVVSAEFSCPYDSGDCGLLPSLTPAVLTVPPLDPPPHTDGLAWFGVTPGTGRPAAAEMRPRAPDLHVLQVLRT